ncbi:hypothetical protein DPMN_039427 [Dreissena polymorpha]|uniref:Uncharacterized protein n=1 Tax=Dreissena polymorpha TaxID=45954 RepID=A0A9D4MI47_DREPO|nr:hypothetical protein DPMN_039427 [Dreissena polymorpha]
MLKVVMLLFSKGCCMNFRTVDDVTKIQSNTRSAVTRYFVDFGTFRVLSKIVTASIHDVSETRPIRTDAHRMNELCSSR